VSPSSPNRRQYLQVLSLGLATGAGCTFPSSTSEERIEPGSIEFRNTTSERADMELEAWRLDRGRTPTATASVEPQVTSSLSAPAESTVLDPGVFSTWTWRIRVRAGGRESTVEFEIVDPAFVGVTLYTDRVRVGLAGNTG
jgi:hypothetical protein